MSTRVAVRPAVNAIGTVPSAVHRLSRHAITQWRRSLQLRVVTTTFLVSATVVALLGFFLMQQVANGLLRAKENAALTEAEAGLTVAQNQYQMSGGDSGDPRERSALLDQLASTLARRSGSAGLYEVIILYPSGADLGRASNAISPSSVPARLRETVRETRGNKPSHTYTQLYYDDNKRPVPGLVVGAPLGPYQLYHLFPLNEERETLALVQRLLTAVGAGLVLLLAAIAWIVTRQVVTPVRLAAQAAELLAAGRLEERLRVRGEDDLARLAASFNQMATNLQEKIRELEELSQVQRQFVSDVSHELRTPLTTVRIAADLLYEHRADFDPAVSRSAELLQNQLERFEALLTDLLEISRYDAGAATLDAESVDVRDVVLRAVGDTEQLAEQRDTKVVLRLPGLPCLAEVDGRRVERILRNLIVNAIEHGEGRDIIITAAADRDAIAVTVRDHGVGLRLGEPAQVFKRFWRADPARARRMGGTGLGLSIALEDAQLHGGWLQAWGEPGRGSQFRLSLPRVAGQRLRGSPLPLVPPEVELVRGRLRILQKEDAEQQPVGHER
ncbi:MAG: HAMP domain-containing protein [Streptosporangiales bacterium]|nr:HAMP domain-containing protein [Streptosporangiales bacterium]